ncbi:MAG: two-component hybrid sensor and regulator, partial [Myxococcales bacterium]|nr:two-component hybrid sensor and regulator [Myxococcales bacterium]
MSPSTIMVVDDNAATRRMVRTALQRNGHIVVEAEDGRTARALIQSEQPRVVLQDLVLPDVDGFELVGELRKLAGREVTILAFSGLVSKLDESRISSVGFDDMITKPIAPSRLVPLIEAYLPAAFTTAERFGEGRHLVVADDDPLQLKLAAFRLGRLGFTVETAPHGRAALEVIRRRKPDVIVSDVMMPELDGFGLAMAVRQDPEFRNLPLVLVTSSYVDPSDRELARRAGADDLVVRTPELVELIDHLRFTFTRKQAPAVLHPETVPELERVHYQRVLRQLERQVMLNSGLAKRCSSLASELTVLSGIAESVLKNRDIDIALDEAIGTCFDAGGISVGALYLVDPRGPLTVRSVGPDARWARDDLATFFGREDLLRSVIERGAPLYLPSSEVASDITADVLARCAATAVLVVPLSSTDGPLGALLMVARDREIDEGDWRAFAVGVGNQISQVLTLSRAYADREAAEAKAANHAALLEAVVESAPDFVVQIDLEGRIGFVNRTVAPVLPSELIGMSWTARMLPDQREAAEQAFQTVVETGVPAGFDFQSSTSPGSSWFQGRLGPVRRDGKIIGCVLIARDVTEKKHTEMQLMLADRMASVGTLAAGVAHEINNPLASVIANLDMAQQDVADLATSGVVLPKDLPEELADARSSADRVREIVRDLKIFSRAEEDQRRAVDVQKVLESTLRMAWNEVR